MDYEVESVRFKGKLKKTWRGVMKKDCRVQQRRMPYLLLRCPFITVLSILWTVVIHGGN